MKEVTQMKVYNPPKNGVTKLFKFEELNKKSIKEWNIKSIKELIKELIKEKEDSVSNIPSTSKKSKRRLWTIFGGWNDKEKLICLHVGSSVDIQKELETIFTMMIVQPELRKVDTAFHTVVYSYEMNNSQNHVKYRTIYDMCDKFIVYEILAEEYLKYREVVNEKGYDIVNYAEVQFAYDYKALLWNPAPEMKDNKEREILNHIIDNERNSR